MGHACSLIVHHDRDADPVSEAVSELESIGLVQTAKAAIAGTRRVEIELTDSVLDDVEDTERQIHRITRKFGLHVVLVLAVSASDAFLYLHWHNGRVVRSLGCSLEDEGMWSRVSGDPEGWEAEAFDGGGSIEIRRPFAPSRAQRCGRN